MRWQRRVGMLVFATAMLGRGLVWGAEAEPGAPAPTPADAAAPTPAAAPGAGGGPAPTEAAPPPAAAEAPAPVAEESEYVRRGWYAQLGFIYAPSAFKLDNAESQLPPSRIAGDSLSGNNKFGLDARVGYRLRPRWAVEGNYQYIPGFSVERRGGDTLTDLNVHGLWLQGKYFLLQDTFQPYLVGGGGMLHANADGTIQGFSGDGWGFAGRMGAGADVYLRPNVVVNVEFSVVLPTGGVADVRYLPLVFGAQYRF